jgi:hypothetical protein
MKNESRPRSVLVELGEGLITQSEMTTSAVLSATGKFSISFTLRIIWHSSNNRSLRRRASARVHNGEDGGQYEAVFETDEQSVGKTVDKEKAEEIAMDWMQVFYGEQVGTIESQELKTTPVPHWLFRMTVDEPVKRTYFVVLLANGTVVQPRVARRL